MVKFEFREASKLFLDRSIYLRKSGTKDQHPTPEPNIDSTRPETNQDFNHPNSQSIAETPSHFNLPVFSR